MKKIGKLSVVLAAVMAIFAPALTLKTATVCAAPSAQKVFTAPTGYTSAGDVEYKITNNVVANWGARGEDCTFLSSYAVDFYTGDYEYEMLSKKAGSHKQTEVPSSALYTSLAKLMKDKHTFFTYYDGSKNVRDYYKYTDCVANDTTKISTIYRCVEETSTWNQGNIWNQEHVFPQALLNKANAGSQEIGDIMHLRPSNPSENSSRGNKGYGESSGYYNPGPSVRGDCARMVLYMYVRWGVTKTMWGASGVMESIDVLLDWMEEDPVDTWEMGRNDAVQSVTHTRNVFVDYPEYAWILFDRDFPENMVTPSGIAMNTENDDNDSSDSSDNSSSVEDDVLDSESAGTEECEHEFGRWFVIENPTEDKEGERQRFCAKCRKSEKEFFSEDLYSEGVANSFGCVGAISGGFAGVGVLLGCIPLLKKRKDG